MVSRILDSLLDPLARVIGLPARPGPRPARAYAPRLPPPIGNMLDVDVIELGDRLALHDAGEVVEYAVWPQLVAKLFPEYMSMGDVDRVRRLISTAANGGVLRADRFAWPTNLLIRSVGEGEVVVGFLTERPRPVHDRYGMTVDRLRVEQLLTMNSEQLDVTLGGVHPRYLYLRLAETVSAAHEDGVALGPNIARRCSVGLDRDISVFVFGLDECIVYDEVDSAGWSEAKGQDLAFLRHAAARLLGTQPGSFGSDMQAADYIAGVLGIRRRGTVADLAKWSTSVAAVDGDHRGYLSLRGAFPDAVGRGRLLFATSLVHALSALERPGGMTIERQGPSATIEGWQWPEDDLVTAARVEIVPELDMAHSEPIAVDVARRSSAPARLAVDLADVNGAAEVTFSWGADGPSGLVFGARMACGAVG